VQLPSPKLWTRDFVLVGLSALLLLMSQTFLLVTLPLYAVQWLGASKAQVGLLPGLVTITALLARPLAGYAVDRWGRRSFQLVSLLGVAVCAMGYGFVPTFAILAMNRLLYGFAYGVASTASVTVVTDLIPPQRRGEGIGYFGIAQTLGMALGPAVALLVLGDGQFTRLFVVGGGLVLVSVLLVLPVRHLRLINRQARLRPTELFESSVVPIALVVGGMMLGYGSLTSFVTLYAVQLGVSNPGLFFTAQSAGTVLARIGTGAIYDRQGPKNVVGAGLLLLLASYLVLALWRSPLGFYVAAFGTGLGVSAAFPALQAMAISSVPGERRGAANATYLASVDLGIAVGSYLLGVVGQWSGSLATMYQVSAATVLVPLALFYRVVLPRHRAGRS
jgi:MFS family permease